MPAEAREQRLVLGIAAAAVLSVAAALLVRLPEDAGLGFSLLRHGPTLLLALATGFGFGVAGAVQTHRDPHGRAHAILFAASVGAAFGALRVAGDDGGFGRFVLGALAGGGAFAALVAGAARLPRVARLAMGVLLVAGLGIGISSVVGAKADPAGVRATTFWLLGDLSRARLATALPVSIAIAALGLHVLRGVAAPGEAARRALDGRAALLFGLCLGAAGLVAFVAWLAALLSARLLGRDDPRQAAALSGGIGALLMVWASALPLALFGGFAPPLGLSVALVAVPVFVLRGDGASPRWARGLEIALGVAAALATAGLVYALASLAAAIA